MKEEENELVTNCHQLKMRVAAEWIKKEINKAERFNLLLYTCYFLYMAISYSRVGALMCSLSFQMI